MGKRWQLFEFRDDAPVEIDPVWVLPNLWRDREVAVVATGPGATPDAVDALRGMACVVVKHSHLLAPWADALVAHDATWWAGNTEARAFEGLRICAQPAGPGVNVYPVPWERARIGPGHELEIRSSGLMAIRFAVAGGAAALRLVGFDGGPGHWHGGKPRPAESIAPAAVALDGLVAELASRGIQVTRA